MNKFDFVTVGGVTEDVSLVIEDYQVIDNPDPLVKKLLSIEYGAKILAPTSFVNYGGGAANLALAIRRQGLKVAIITSIGSDRRGQDILTNLKTNKIDTSFVQVVKQTQSAMSAVLIGQDGEHTIITYRGANNHLEVNSQLAQSVSTSWFYVSSLGGSHWSKTLNNLFKSQKKIAWNPGQQQLAAGFNRLADYLRKTNILILNNDEALELVSTHQYDKKKLLDYEQDIVMLIKKIHKYGPQLVVITADKDGSWAFDGQEVIHQSAVPVKKIIDTTGVGDAFGGTLVANLAKNKNLKNSLATAAHQASLVLQDQGAQSLSNR